MKGYRGYENGGSVARGYRDVEDILDPSSKLYGQRHGGSFVTGALDSLTRALTLPGRVYRGEVDLNDRDKAVEESFNAAGALTGGGLGRAAVSPGTAGTEIGIFAGKAARRPPEHLSKVEEEMAHIRAARDPEYGPLEKDLWKEHGIGINRDGRAMFEIDDSKSRFNMPDFGPSRDDFPDAMSYLKAKDSWRAKGGENATKNLTMKQVLDHPELWDQYPDLGDVPVRFTYDTDPSAPIGGMNHVNGTPQYFELNRAYDPKTLHSTSLHELQHGVQGTEGWTIGTNPSSAKSLVNSQNRVSQNIMDAQAMKDLVNAGWDDEKILNSAIFGHIDNPENKAAILAQAKAATPEQLEAYYKQIHRNRRVFDEPFATYERNEGESMARNTQNRMNLTARQRKNRHHRSTEDRPGEPRYTVDRGKITTHFPEDEP